MNGIPTVTMPPLVRGLFRIPAAARLLTALYWKSAFSPSVLAKAFHDPGARAEELVRALADPGREHLELLRDVAFCGDAPRLYRRCQCCSSSANPTAP